MRANRGVPAERAARGGALVAGLLAMSGLLGGVWVNQVSDVVVLPGVLGEPAGLFAVFAVFGLITVTLTLGARRLDRSAQGGEETTGAADNSVAIVAGDGSAARRFSIWPMAEFTPDLATVHTAIGRRASAPRPGGRPAELAAMPPYIRRDHDPGLVADVVTAAGGGLEALILLEGGSSTGKTRSLFEAVRAHCSGFQVVRPHNPAALRALPASGLLSESATVLWLNELQGFLGPVGTGLTRTLLSDLYSASSYPLVVVGTLWPDKLRALTDPGDEGTRDTRELLAESVPEVRWCRLPPRFNPDELGRAREVAWRDQRIADALDDRERFGFTQVLAGAHVLLRFYEAADAATRLVIEAAADARRLGIEGALPASLLKAVADALWREDHGSTAPPENCFEKALGEATKPLSERQSGAGVRALVPLRDPDGYTLADYIEQHLVAQRRNLPVRDKVWTALYEQAPRAALRALAQEAHHRGRVAIEHNLLGAAVAAGAPGARYSLARSHELLGHVAEAELAYRDAVTASELDAYSVLARWLQQHGRLSEVEQALREAIDAGERYAQSNLANWLEQQRRSAEAEQAWRDAITAAEPNARNHFVRWLVGRDRRAEAEQPLRDAITGSEPDAHSRLATWLMRQGRIHEAEQAWRNAVTVGEPKAHSHLAGWLEDQGRFTEAEQVYRAAITADEPNANGRLASSLDQQGRPTEAEHAYRDAIAAGETSAYCNLASWLDRQGRPTEAEHAYRDGITAGEPFAHTSFATWLDQQDRPVAAEQARRDRAVAGEPHAHVDLANWLDQQERPTEAERARRNAIIAGEPHAHLELAFCLAQEDRPSEAEQAYRGAVIAGEPHAPSHLANWLERSNRIEEAARVRSTGLDENGQTLY